MKEKLELIQSIFKEGLEDRNPPFPQQMHGTFYGGVYNGRRYFYSKSMLEGLSIEKLEKLIKKQIGYEN